jgi:hypothetical protein
MITQPNLSVEAGDAQSVVGGRPVESQRTLAAVRWFGVLA